MKKSIFNIKDRKELRDSIEGLERQIVLTRNQMEAIPKMSGYVSVQEVENVYRTAKQELELIKAQAEWDEVPINLCEGATEGKKASVLKQLAEKQRVVNGQKQGQYSIKQNKIKYDSIEI